jgi:hypothetical protein
MKSVTDVAKELAQSHRESDPATTVIKFFPSGQNGSIRLVEVSASAPTTDEVLPFGFASDPDNGVDYPSVVILLSPEEWQHVQEGSLPLPTGWNLAEAEDL